MYEQLISRSKEAWIAWLVLILSLACLMVLSPLKWTTEEGIPITLQSLLVVLIPVLVGWKLGTMAVLIYLIAGAMGLPVFAYGTSGWERFIGSTGGFLLAFPITALLCGWAAERIQKNHVITGTLTILAGQLLILALGLLWQRSIVPISETVTETLSRLIPGLLVKTAFGGLAIVVFSRLLEQAFHRLNKKHV